MSYTTNGTFEKLDYGQPGWNHVYNSNIHKINKWYLKFRYLDKLRLEKAPANSGSYVLKQADTYYVDPVKIKGQGI